MVEYPFLHRFLLFVASKEACRMVKDFSIKVNLRLIVLATSGAALLPVYRSSRILVAGRSIGQLIRRISMASPFRRSFLSSVALALGLAVSVWPARGSTGSGQLLTLSQVVDSTLANNKTMDNVRKSISVARLYLNATKKERLPKIRTGYSYMRTFNSIAISGEYPSESDPGVMDTFTVSFPKDNYTWTSSLSMPLLSRVQDLSEVIAKLGVNVAEVQLIQAKNELLANAKLAYFAILRDRSHLVFLEQNLKSLDEHEKLTRHYHQQGVVAKNSVMEAVAERANAEYELEAARQSHVVSQATLATFMGLADKGVSFTPGDRLEKRPWTHSLADCLKYARTHNPELVAFGYLKRQAGKEVDLEKAHLKPTLDLSAYYLKYGDTPGLKNTEGEGFPSEVMAATVSVNWLLTDCGQKKTEARAKKIKLEQLVNQESLAIDRIELRLREAFAQYKASEKNIETWVLGLGAARENLRLTRIRYREQTATSKEVVDALTAHKRAEFSHFTALHAHNAALTRLEEAMGMEAPRIVLGQN